MNSLSTKFILHDMLPESLLLKAERQFRTPSKADLCFSFYRNGFCNHEKKGLTKVPLCTHLNRTPGEPHLVIYLLYF